MSRSTRRVVLLVVVVLTAAACGEDAGTTTEPGPTSEGSVTTAEAAGSGMKVAYLPCGRANDQSWSQSGWEGMQEAEQRFGLEEIALSEAVPVADIEAAIRDYASRDFDMIFAHCGTFADVVEQVAPDFPDTWFELTSLQTSEVANGFAYDPQQQEGSFLAGILAGLTTETNTLGAIVGFDFPAMVRQSEGFRLGARFVNPDVELIVTYINSWEDASLAKEAALAQIESGVDITFIATDQAGAGVFEAASEQGIYTIPLYRDQRENSPETILTSVNYNIPQSLAGIIELAVNEELEEFATFQPGVAEDVGVLTPFYDQESVVPERAKECADLVRQAVVDGVITIPDTAALGTDGAGLGIDPASIVEGGQHECLGG